jgi:hypothetical protein
MPRASSRLQRAWHGGLDRGFSSPRGAAIVKAVASRSKAALAALALLAACSKAGGPPGAPSIDTSASVLERNKHPSRDGHFVQPLLTKAKAASMKLDAGFKATFSGTVVASPLYAENGPGGAGAFFAVTLDNNVFALAEATGAVLWETNVGAPAMMTGVPCGNLRPIGIFSTPVIDASSRTIFVGAGIAAGGTTIARHEVHALSLDDGKERPGWPVDVSKVKAGALAFNSPAQNQRGSLALVNGTLYVPYGGHDGDCGAYHGWIVAIDIKNPATVGAWATGGLGEAIWAAGGLASDGNGIFAVTGNNTQGVAVHFDSEEVVRITGTSTLTLADVYFPSRWRSMDLNDADFGGSNALVVDVPGATPPSYVVATSKDGHVYFLDRAKLGGMDGHLVDYTVVDGKQESSRAVRTAPTSYASATGVHIALSVDSNSVCPMGVGGGGRVVMSILVPPGAPPKVQTAWCAPLGGSPGVPSTSPISTTTDGKSDAIVWIMSGWSLNAFDGDTGAVISASTELCTGGVRQWTSPIAVKGRIVVGGDGHLCSWSPQ